MSYEIRIKKRKFYSLYPYKWKVVWYSDTFEEFKTVRRGKDASWNLASAEAEKAARIHSRLQKLGKMDTKWRYDYEPPKDF